MNIKKEILILVLIISLFIKKVFIQKKLFENHQSYKSQPITYILGEKEKYYCFEDYIDSFIDKMQNTRLILYNTVSNLAHV